MKKRLLYLSILLIFIECNSEQKSNSKAASYHYSPSNSKKELNEIIAKNRSTDLNEKTASTSLPRKEVVSLSFLNKTPYWPSYWAGPGLAVVVLCFSWGFIKWRTAKLKSQINLLTINLNSQEILQKSTLKETEKLKAILQETTATKDKILSLIGHDLGNPVFQLKMGLKMLKEEKFTDAERQETLEVLQADINKTYNLLNNLWLWAISQKEKMVFQPNSHRIEPIIAQNVALFARLAKQKNIALSAETPKNCSAYFDDYMINLVLQNLLSNALKFTESNGAVKITCKTSDKNSLEISVSDNGVGIPEEQVVEIFSNSSYTSTFDTKHIKGAGLGLKLSKDLVEKNGGKITVESVEGKGTTFILCLPLEAIHSA